MDKLIIYNKALSLVVEVYKLIRNSPQLAKDFSLCDQLKRACVSVCVNIAEGYGRSTKLFKNYLQISSGSANEVVALLQIVQALYNINTHHLQEEYKYLGKQINAFSKKLTVT